MKPSTPATVSSLRTRRSLLLRVRSWEDQTSWAEFHGLYRELVHGLARRAGLSHADAEDVTQDVFKRVAETIHQFESDPNRGTFRGWLMNLTRWRVADKYASKPKGDQRDSPRRDDTAGPRTATIDRVPDGVDLNAEWEIEWQRHIIQVGSARIAKRVKPWHYRVFDLHVIQRWPAPKVASELGITVDAVWLVSHRLTKQLKAEVTKLKEQLG